MIESREAMAFAACRARLEAQAEIIKAQRANLDAARKFIDNIEKHAIYWSGISALDDDMINAERWSETAKRCRIALEGVEPEEKPMAE